MENAIFNFVVSEGNLFLLYSTYLQWAGDGGHVEQKRGGVAASASRGIGHRWGLPRDAYSYEGYSEDNYRSKAIMQEDGGSKKKRKVHDYAFARTSTVVESLLGKSYSGRYGFNDTAKQFLHGSDVDKVDAATLQRLARLFHVELTRDEASQCLRSLGLCGACSAAQLKEHIGRWRRNEEGKGGTRQLGSTKLPSSLRRACSQYQKTVNSMPD